MTRTFGIEIEAFNATQFDVVQAMRAEGLIAETASYNNSDASYWRIKTDASISGENAFEVVSPILTDLADVAKCCRALATVNAKVNQSTGLHVHIGAADLKLADWKNMVKRYRDNETIIDCFMPRSRRENNARYVQSIIGLMTSTIDSATNVRQLGNLMRTRYLKLNVQSFVKHGTVEFRQHSGTVDFEKISKWVEFCLNFVSASIVKSKTSRIKDDMVLENVKRNHREMGSDAFEVHRCYVEGETVENFYDRVSALNLRDSKKAARCLRDDLKKGRVTLSSFSSELSGEGRGLWAMQTADTETFYSDRAEALR